MSGKNDGEGEVPFIGMWVGLKGSKFGRLFQPLKVDGISDKDDDTRVLVLHLNLFIRH